MTTATLVLLALMLALGVSPIRLLAIFLLATLLYLNPIPSVIALIVLGLAYTNLKRYL